MTSTQFGGCFLPRHSRSPPPCPCVPLETAYGMRLILELFAYMALSVPDPHLRLLAGAPALGADLGLGWAAVHVR